MGLERSRGTQARGVAAAGALAAWALAGATAAGAPAVLAPVDLSAPGASAATPRVGMDGSGGLVSLWLARTDSAERVMASTRPPGGPATPAGPLSPPGSAAGSPALAVARTGRALAAWWRAGIDGPVIQVSDRPAGGAFTAAVDLSPPGAFAPEVALAPDGGAVVAWLRDDGTEVVVEAATRVPGGGFAAAARLSGPGGDVLATRVAIDEAGRVAVAWNRSDGRNTRVEVAVGTLAGGMGPARTLSEEGSDAYDPQAALGPDGTTLVAWVRSDGDHARVQIAAVARDVASPTPVTLSPAGADAADPRLAVEASGAALVGWRRGPPGAERVQALTWVPGTQPTTPDDLSAAGVSAAEPDVAVDAAGRAMVTWRRDEASDPRVRLATRDPGGRFGPPVDVSERGVVVAGPRVAMDGAGNGVVVWRRASGPDDIVQMAGLDDAPPVLEDVIVPRTATAGEPVALGARARDVWSALAPGPAWNLGPGAEAVGAWVTHAFPQAGTYLVRVSQADAVGRVAAAERRVDVASRAPSVGLEAPPSPAPAPSARRPITLRVGWGQARRGPRVWLRVRGRTAVALRGRTVIVERRVGRRTAILCRIRVRARGGFDGRCRVERLARRGRIVLRVRARVTSTPTTRARRLPYVTRRLAAPLSRRPAASR